MVKTIFADLHNHTTASDGDFSPEEMVEQAKKAGISVIGITDHDTVKGLNTAVKAGKKYSVEVVTGVEISVKFKRSFFTGTLHLLCYFPAALMKNKIFIKEIENTLSMGRGERLVRTRVDAINRFFGPQGEKAPILLKHLSYEEIRAYGSNTTRRHFAMALNEKHNLKDPVIINKIIRNNSPAYIPSGIDLDTVKNFLKKFPVMSVLAHPAAGSFPGQGHYNEVLPPVEIVEKLLPAFIDAGLKGLEINYPGHIQKHRDMLHKWAKQYNLIVTGGSDCHDAKTRPPGVDGITKKEFIRFKRMLNLNFAIF